MICGRFLARCAFTLGVTAIVSSLQAAEPNRQAIDFFEAKIRPVLVEQCYSCHSAQAKNVKGGLLLDTKAGLLKGGDSGVVLVPGKPQDSLLLKSLRHEGDTKMPPKGKLADTIVKDFTTWIASGAEDPRIAATPAATAGINWETARKFWAFQPVVKPAIPENAGRKPIDRFLLATMQEKGLTPVPLTDKRTLIRRATFAVTGLPPTPDEIDAFLNDSSPDAFTKVVDRLLASPQFGEMQARQWLDVARYAEDQAHTFGVTPNTNAYRYRDWVIDAFNADMPYDQFVRWQIAGDSLAGDDPNLVKNRAALGYFGLGAQYYKNTDAAKAQAEELDDRVDTLTRGFLGLTVSCARCHDHKFDPIPTQDYYSLAGIFSSSKLSNLPIATKAEADKFNEAQKKVQDADKKVKDFMQTKKNEAALAKIDSDLIPYMLAAWKLDAMRLEKPTLTVDEFCKTEKLNAKILTPLTEFVNRPVGKSPMLDAWRKQLPKTKGETAPSADVKKAAESFREEVKKMLGSPGDKNGNVLFQNLFADKKPFAVADKDIETALDAPNKAKIAELRQVHAEATKQLPPPLSIVHGLADGNLADMKVFIRGNPAKQGEVAPRRFLRILSGENPAKVSQGSGRLELANAIADPKNPLTSRVMVNRIWQQYFGRGIVGTPSNFGNLGERPTHPQLLDWLSATFVESSWSVKKLHREILLSDAFQRSSAKDPKNQTIDAENRYLWRMSRQRLQVEAWRDALLAVSGRLDLKMGGPTTDLNQDSNSRRTVYAKISRHELNGFLRLFDFPDANITSDRRSETTVPQQQLFVLNSPFFLMQSRSLSARLQKEASDDPSRIRRAFLLAYGRPVEPNELDLILKFLESKEKPEEASANKLTRWERLAQTLLASNEFMYVD